MMAVHELGHVLAAWMVGAKVERVVLHPFSFSRTDVAANDSSRFITWMGPIVGVALPLLMWITAAACRTTFAFLFRFFAGFCLMANGAYIGFGWSDVGGDASDLRAMGESEILMTVIGTLACLIGLALWNRLASQFGYGKNAKVVQSRVAIGTCATFIALLAIGWTISN